MSRAWWIGGLTLLVCGAYLWQIRLDGFIPGDEGLLGQTAERVMQGEMPHIDFDDTYTGGLALLHAAVFELFGVRSAYLRTLLCCAGLLFLATCYLLCQPATRPWTAALVTSLVMVWTLPNYFAGLPSWYNLFLATFGLGVLVIFARRGERRYLVLAGICGGLSILFKIIGLLFLASALLAVLYFRQRQHAADEDSTAGEGSGPMAAAVGLIALATLGGFLALLRQALTASNLLYYLLPALALVAVLILEERRPKTTPGGRRLRELAIDLTALAGGTLAPVALFLLPYVLVDGGLEALWQGVFVAPSLRVDLVAYPLPTPFAFLYGVPGLLLVVAALVNRSRIVGGLLVAAAIAILYLGDQDLIHTGVWRTARLLLPLALLAGAGLLWRGRREAGDRVLFAALAVLALFSPIQFPYARGIYFCYVAPLLALAVLAVAAKASTHFDAPQLRRGLAGVAVFFALFALLWLNGSSIYPFGRRYEPRPPLTTFAEERVGLRVPVPYARGYGELIAFIRRQVPPDQPILALPDLPQIYYFTARRNPTRLLCDVLTLEPPSAAQYRAWLNEVGLVVINRRPEFSPPISPELDAAIQAAFPRKATLESFEVRYRDRSAP